MNKGPDYMNRYKNPPSQRYERMPGEPIDPHSFEYSYKDNMSSRGPRGYIPKSMPQQPPGPPRSYRRQEYETHDHRHGRDEDYIEPSPKRGSRYEERRHSPHSYQPKSYYPPEVPEERRQDYNRPTESYRDRRDSQDDYHSSNRSHHDSYDHRRNDQSYNLFVIIRYRSPPRLPKYDDLSRGDPTNEDIIQDSVFVSNLPPDTTVNELASLFGSIGVIKADKKTGVFKIKLYFHPDGKPKGEASVCYLDSQAARAAIEWFNQSELRGNTLKVQMAERTYSTRYINSRGTRGGFRGTPRRGDDRGYSRSRSDTSSDMGKSKSKPSFIQPGDWLCSLCKNNNFAWRTTCNRCQALRPESRFL
ncbi:hypothetical protein HZS_7614, partial [Henneguya salminicola]